MHLSSMCDAPTALPDHATLAGVHSLSEAIVFATAYVPPLLWFMLPVPRSNRENWVTNAKARPPTFGCPVLAGFCASTFRHTEISCLDITCN